MLCYCKDKLIEIIVDICYAIYIHVYDVICVSMYDEEIEYNIT